MSSVFRVVYCILHQLIKVTTTRQAGKATADYTYSFLCFICDSLEELFREEAEEEIAFGGDKCSSSDGGF